MSGLPSLLGLLPALVLAVAAAAVPREAKTQHRIGLGAITFFLVAAIRWLWPEGGAATEAAAAAGADGAAAAAAVDEWPSLLNLLIGLPIAGAVAVMFLPRQMLSLLRGFTYFIFGATFVASLWLFSTDMTPGWHFVNIKPWIEEAGIRWHVAIDGISLWLVVLATFTTPIAAFSSFGSIKKNIKELCVAFLLLEGAMIGAFVALDMFVFYVFWELMLVPMFIMIGIWGGAEKIKAAVKFFIFTMTGSVLMLAAMVYMVWTQHELTGVWSWDYLDLAQVILPGPLGSWGPHALCFWAFSIAFFIKVPMFPVHTWLPDAHVQAPTGGSVILAAVMLKMGTYGYLRFSMGLFPGQAGIFAPTLAGVAIMGGILYGALCAWKQNDVKRLVAYSSVAHLGFVMLGLFGSTASGISGAILQMINHGIATGALFMLVGVIYDRRHTREVAEFGGLAKVMPVYAALFIIVTMASIGVPGTNGFVGEFMIIAGTYVAERLNNFGSVQAVGAAFGVILAAVYMLSVVQKMFFGPLTNPKNKRLNDLTTREGLALAPLIICIFVIGLFPRLLLDRMEPSVEAFRQQYTDVYLFATEKHGDRAMRDVAQLLPEALFHDGFLDGAATRKKDETEKLAAATPPANPAVAPPGAAAPGVRPAGVPAPGAAGVRPPGLPQGVNVRRLAEPPPGARRPPGSRPAPPAGAAPARPKAPIRGGGQ